MSRVSRASGLVVVLAVALVLFACGEPAPVGSDGTTEAEAQTLSEFYGWEDYDFETEAEKWLEKEREVQQMAAECMAEEGFDYTPFVYEEAYGRAAPWASLTEEEMKAQYGYGVFTMMLWEAEMMEEQGGPDEPEDPNMTYWESLSESEKRAYELALWGDHETWWEEHEEEMIAAEEAGEYIPELEPTYEDIGGCMNLAYETVGMGPKPEIMGQLDEAWRTLGPLEQELQERIMADERVVEVSSEWSTCMAESGFDFADEEEIWEYLDGKMQDVMGWEEEFPPVTTVPEEPGEGEYVEEWSPWPPGVTEDDIRALADEELAIAAADLACRADYDRVLEEVRREYESRFITENRALLERVRELQQAMRE